MKVFATATCLLAACWCAVVNKVVVVVEACNRYYTSTDDGRVLTRLNRRNGFTKDVGKWTKNVGGDRKIDTMEWNFPNEVMYGFELRPFDLPDRSQRFVRINRQKPRGATVNNITKGLTGRFDLKGLAVDGNNTYYAHSVGTQALYEVDVTTGFVTELFVTGLENVLDLAYKINSDEIWAITGTQIFIIDPRTRVISEFAQTFIARNPNKRFVSIGFNPVKHVPIVLTQGQLDATPVVRPTLYRFILFNKTEVFQGETSITTLPAGGTIQCKRRVFTEAPSARPSAPTVRPTPAPVVPTKLPTPSWSPSEYPSTLTIRRVELIPFSVTVDAVEAVNGTEIELTMEDYLFGAFSQEFNNVELVDLIQVNDLGPGDTLFGTGRRLRQLQGVQQTFFNGGVEFQDGQNPEVGLVQNTEVLALGNQSAVTEVIVNANTGVSQNDTVLNTKLHSPTEPPSSLPSLLPSAIPSGLPSSMPSTIPSKTPSIPPVATPAPVATTPAPVMVTPAPVTVTLAPVASTPAPISAATPAPIASTPAPLTPAPVTVSPVTVAPATDAPATDAPATDAPATGAPATDAPASDAPASDAPATDAPASDAPVTEAPVTPAPVTEAPVTEAPVTEASVTEAPVTEVSVTEAPLTTAPATVSPVTASPVTSPVTPAPVTSAPVTPAPVTPAPVTPAPITPAPITPAPITPAPITPAPVTPAPVTPAPVTPAPVTPAPVTPAPVTPAPVTPALVTPTPVTPAPVTPAPVTPAPISVNEVTEPPSSAPSSSSKPSLTPSSIPSVSLVPSSEPSSVPSASARPSRFPSVYPTASLVPSVFPSGYPTVSTIPSQVPSAYPSASVEPSLFPSAVPSSSVQPSLVPSGYPSSSSAPSLFPSAMPSASVEPSLVPSWSPSSSSAPSQFPSALPSISVEPSLIPSSPPSVSSAPSWYPSGPPSSSVAPSWFPSSTPSTSVQPSLLPSTLPSAEPSLQMRPPPCEYGMLYFGYMDGCFCQTCINEECARVGYVDLSMQTEVATDGAVQTSCEVLDGAFDLDGNYYALCHDTYDFYDRLCGDSSKDPCETDVEVFFGVVNLQSGVASPLTLLEYDEEENTYHGLAFNEKDGRFYTIEQECDTTPSCDWYLVAIDRAGSGEAYQGPITSGVDPANIYALAVDPSGNKAFFAFDSTQGPQLAEVDLASGSGTIVGDLSDDDGDWPITALAFVGSTLYGIRSEPMDGPTDEFDGVLSTIDTTDAEVAPVYNVGVEDDIYGASQCPISERPAPPPCIGNRVYFSYEDNCYDDDDDPYCISIGSLDVSRRSFNEFVTSPSCEPKGGGAMDSEGNYYVICKDEYDFYSDQCAEGTALLPCEEEVVYFFGVLDLHTGFVDPITLLQYDEENDGDDRDYDGLGYDGVNDKFYLTRQDCNVDKTECWFTMATIDRETGEIMDLPNAFSTDNIRDDEVFAMAIDPTGSTAFVSLYLDNRDLFFMSKVDLSTGTGSIVNKFGASHDFEWEMTSLVFIDSTLYGLAEDDGVFVMIDQDTAAVTPIYHAFGPEDDLFGGAYCPLPPPPNLSPPCEGEMLYFAFEEDCYDPDEDEDCLGIGYIDVLHNTTARLVAPPSCKIRGGTFDSNGIYYVVCADEFDVYDDYCDNDLGGLPCQEDLYVLFGFVHFSKYWAFVEPVAVLEIDDDNFFYTGLGFNDHDGKFYTARHECNAPLTVCWFTLVSITAQGVLSDLPQRFAENVKFEDIVDELTIDPTGTVAFVSLYIDENGLTELLSVDLTTGEGTIIDQVGIDNDGEWALTSLAFMGSTLYGITSETDTDRDEFLSIVNETTAEVTPLYKIEDEFWGAIVNVHGGSFCPLPREVAPAAPLCQRGMLYYGYADDCYSEGDPKPDVRPDGDPDCFKLGSLELATRGKNELVIGTSCLITGGTFTPDGTYFVVCEDDYDFYTEYCRNGDDRLDCDWAVYTIFGVLDMLSGFVEPLVLLNIDDDPWYYAGLEYSEADELFYTTRQDCEGNCGCSKCDVTMVAIDPANDFALSDLPELVLEEEIYDDDCVEAVAIDPADPTTAYVSLHEDSDGTLRTVDLETGVGTKVGLFGAFEDDGSWDMTAIAFVDASSTFIGITSENRRRRDGWLSTIDPENAIINPSFHIGLTHPQEGWTEDVHGAAMCPL